MNKKIKTEISTQIQDQLRVKARLPLDICSIKFIALVCFYLPLIIKWSDFNQRGIIGQ